LTDKYLLENHELPPQLLFLGARPYETKLFRESAGSIYHTLPRNASLDGSGIYETKMFRGSGWIKYPFWQGGLPFW
jgi:hypothetical protein